MVHNELEAAKEPVPSEVAGAPLLAKDTDWWRDEEKLAEIRRLLAPLRDAMAILASAATVVGVAHQICQFCTGKLFEALDAQMPSASDLTHEAQVRAKVLGRASDVVQRAARVVAITPDVVNELTQSTEGHEFSKDDLRTLGENLARAFLETDVANEGVARSCVRALELSKRPVTATARPRPRS